MSSSGFKWIVFAFIIVSSYPYYYTLKTEPKLEVIGRYALDSSCNLFEHVPLSENEVIYVASGELAGYPDIKKAINCYNNIR